MPSTAGIVSAAGFLKNPAEASSLGYRINYVSNPAFEVDTTGWEGVDGGTLARITSDFQSGSACLEVTNTVESGAQTATRVPLVEGDGTYYMSAYVKIPTGGTSANMFLRYLQYETLESTSTVGTGNVGTTAVTDADGWVRLTGSFTKATIANYMVFRIVTDSTTSSDTFLVDSVMLEYAALGDYFDGSNGGFWTGAAHNSFSGATPY